MLKTEGRRPVQFRDACASKFVAMAVFLCCQEGRPQFRVTFQLVKLEKIDTKAFRRGIAAAFLATALLLNFKMKNTLWF